MDLSVAGEVKTSTTPPRAVSFQSAKNAREPHPSVFHLQDITCSQSWGRSQGKANAHGDTQNNVLALPLHPFQVTHPLYPRAVQNLYDKYFECNQ